MKDFHYQECIITIFLLSKKLLENEHYTSEVIKNFLKDKLYSINLSFIMFPNILL